VRYFFSQVAAQLAAAGHEPVDVANVCDEVFDMVRARGARGAAGFTLADLHACRMGGTACGILLDTAAFQLYDRREELRSLGQLPEDALAEGDYED
jgi:hypothetical protein